MTERNLLSDHIPKCGRPQSTSPVKTNREPLNDRPSKNGPLSSKIKWRRGNDGRSRSREKLNGRSRSRANKLDNRGRSRSRDALDQIGRPVNRTDRGRSRSTENLIEEPFDLAREIERDIERINLAQGKLRLL